jgi:hypothetical protein
MVTAKNYVRRQLKEEPRFYALPFEITHQGTRLSVRVSPSCDNDEKKRSTHAKETNMPRVAWRHTPS